MELDVQLLYQCHPNQNHTTYHLYLNFLFDFNEYPDLIKIL
jgi:hypothetical protein